MTREQRKPGGRGPSGPPPRPKTPRTPPAKDPARQAAFDTLRAITERDAYANLALPALLAERRISGRDAALATELCYGTARAVGLLDTVIAACANRPLSTLDTAVLDGLRLGAYQLLRTRIPSHAAVSSTVDLIRAEAGSRSSGFVNAVLRKIADKDEATWLDELAPADKIEALALRTAHPKWIARAFGAALGDGGAELEAALRADDERPSVHLTARPGEISADELAAISAGEPAPYSPYGVHLDSGDPGELEPVRERLAHVQDEGSQLCALALHRAELDQDGGRWLDLCAGPGGKAALLGALAGTEGARLDAVEQSAKRAGLVRQACEGLPVTVHVADGRDPGLEPGYDRVLVDAPCTGLGALRRRPEARWRRDPSDVSELTQLQRELLGTALGLVRPGGVVAYVVCSPHLPETVGVVADALRRNPEVSALDARELFPGVPDLGPGPYVQLWPHRHGTDAMFCAVLRRGDAR
ncbi:RsmB/NOP family class I SAM-dependent RNA methyltransferase [Sciscionella sediminilitoris]|uniref:RsmB/NOP family class I SAM-dependent RNA methyltransferase n=1 Tax=Sciscionella sediminilitoris TaxID=1445613 RepID=UPI0004DFC7FD|nr:RsmB/NOP family class I SAM-dependent RNA methyltransferase [Sciscionella sp. SE31]